jgi:hypothetical protein
MSRQLLFSDRDLSNVLAQNSAALEQEIQGLTGEQLADTNRETLVRALVTKYTPRTPVLTEDQRGREGPFETEVDVRHDPNRVIFDQSRPVYVHGFRLTVVYPFEGDRDLFACRPNTWSSAGPPAGSVRDQELRLDYEFADDGAETLDQRINRDVQEVKQYLGWVEQDVGAYVGALDGLVERLIAQRQQQLASKQRLIDGLDIPPKSGHSG